jgi:hypothetical protein
MRSRDKKEKNCLYCNNLIPNRNIYCDNICQKKYEKKEDFNLIVEGEFDKLGSKQTIDRVSKQYLISLHGEKCMGCGWCEINSWTNKVPIELNHIDGDPENHSVTNLELLCPNCHSLTEFYKSRGKGRKWRKTIFLK